MIKKKWDMFAESVSMSLSNIAGNKMRTFLTTLGIIIGVADAEVAGILQRYFADFSIMFLMAAVLIAFIMNENLDRRSALYGLFLRIMPVLVFVGVVYSVLLCFVAESGWWSDAYPWAYQSLLETFQFWT